MEEDSAQLLATDLAFFFGGQVELSKDLTSPLCQNCLASANDGTFANDVGHKL
jgi:hypothetical protein